MISLTLRKTRLLGLGLAFMCLAGMSAVTGALDPSDWFMSGTRSAGFVLEDIKIAGLNRTSQTEVLARLDTDRGAPLMSVDLEKTQSLLSSLPWVKMARVSRELPSILRIDITEREPFALWQLDGDVQLIDRDGTPIKGQRLKDFPGLILYVGQGANFEAQALQKALATVPGLSSDIQSAIWIGDRRWDLVFKGGVRVKMPEATAERPLADSLQKFSDWNREHRLLDRDVTAIDLRVPGQLILRLNPEARHLLNRDFTST